MSNDMGGNHGWSGHSFGNHSFGHLGSPTSPARILALVAKRELTTRVRTKSFLISNAIILALILGGIIAASVFADDPDSHPRLGLVGTATSLSGSLSASSASIGNPVDASTVSDEATADPRWPQVTSTWLWSPEAPAASPPSWMRSCPATCGRSSTLWCASKPSTRR